MCLSSHLDSSSGPGLSLGGYFCPQCHATYTELPVECKVCGMYCSVKGLDEIFFSFCCCVLTGLCAVLSPRFDSGVSPPSRQILSPPLPPPSFCRESSGEAPRRRVAVIYSHIEMQMVFHCMSYTVVVWFQVLSGMSSRAEG